MPVAPSATSSRALLAALGAAVVLALAAPHPAKAQDARLTASERADFVKRTLDAMSPAQRRALQEKIQTEIDLAKQDVAPGKPPGTEPVLVGKKTDAGWWDSARNAVGSVSAWIWHKIGPAPSRVAPDARARIASLEATLTVLRGSGSGDSREVFETIANLTRLAYLVCDDRIIDRGDSIDYWKDDIDRFIGRYAKTVKSVGIIEVKGLALPRGVSHCPPPYPEFMPVGTGFVAANGLLVTNRHVLEYFAEATAAGNWAIKSGLKARVAFERAYAACNARAIEFDVTGVAGVHPELDFAVLRVGASATSPPALPIATTPARAREVIAVIGYPSCDGRVRRRDEILVFGGAGGEPPVFHVERLQPGEIMVTDTPDRHFRHDASTLGGNSGSPVMRMSDGTVLGIHKSGLPYQYNTAIQADALAAFLRNLPPAR